MKLLNKFIVLAMLIFITSNKTFAYDFEDNGFRFNIVSIEDNTCEVTKSEKEGDVLIPAEAHYQGRTLKVVRVGNEAFYNCSDITSLTIEEGVEEIGKKSFGFCKGITKVVVPNSLKIVGTGAFAGCSNVERIEIKNLETWCQIEYGGTFIIVDYNKGDVTQYASSMGGSSDKAKLYLNNKLMTEVQIPASISEIKAKTFFNLQQIKRVTLHSNVTKIGLQAFYQCKNLETINLPSSIVSIDAQAFDNCVSLKAIDIPAGCKEIGDYAFRNCKLISDVLLHEGLDKLGEGTFQNCTSLNEIVIPSTINALPFKVFDHCYLNKVVLSPSENSIYLGRNSLGGTTSIEIHRPFSMYYLEGIPGNAPFYNIYYQDSTKRYLKEIVIGKEVLSVPYHSFVWDSPISVKFEDSDLSLELEYGNIFGYKIEALYIGRLLSRNYSAKYESDDLFGKCTTFKSIAIANQLDDDDISFLKLSKYHELEDLTIGGKISSIPDMSSCVKLDRIIVYGTNPPTAIGFANKTFLDCKLYVPYGCKGKYMNADVWKNFWNISEMDYIPSGINMTETGDTSQPETFYTIDGKKVISPQKGVYIFKKSDGNVKKVYVK
ncbi:MAG: leucine-rich repeat domain-containing protein [Prevotella sp.]|nr:leucine-rich repeat domain-containing protein [Prevotella sp.]